MSIAKNTGYNLAGAVISTLVSIACVPAYLAVIGVERFGVLALCWLIASLVNFLGLGIGPALSQRLAGLKAAPEDERADTFWSAIWLTCILGAIGAVVLLLVAQASFDEGAAGSSLSTEMWAAVPWLAGMIPVVMLSDVMASALKGREQFLAMNLINTASSLCVSLLPLGVALLFGPRLEGLVAAVLAGRAIALSIAYATCAKAVPFACPRRPVRRIMRELLAFASWVTFALLLGPAIAAADRFLVAAMLGAAAVATYAILFNLVSRMTMLALSLAGALSPRFTVAEGDAATDLQVESVAVLVTILTPLSILFLMAAGPFVHVWLGAELAAEATSLGYILIIGFWMNSISHVPHAFLEARGRPDLIAKLLVVYLLPYAALLYFAVDAFGLVGAAIATTVRSFFDPTLFVLAGTFRRVFPIIALPALILLCATGAALLFPWTSLQHWAVLGMLLALSCFLAAKAMPASLRATQARVRSAVALAWPQRPA